MLSVCYADTIVVKVKSCTTIVTCRYHILLDKPRGIFHSCLMHFHSLQLHTNHQLFNIHPWTFTFVRLVQLKEVVHERRCKCHCQYLLNPA